MILDASIVKQYAMPGRRRKKTYSPEKLKGLQIVSRILQDIRLSQPDHSSYRKFIDLLDARTGERFTISAIQRYEKAGRITDSRFGVINDIHPDYLTAIEPFAPYPIEWLLRASEGDFIFMANYDGATLREIIDSRQEQLGERWQAELKKWDILAEEIEDARSALISEMNLIRLSGLLEVPIEAIQLAAMHQLRQETPDDSLGDLPGDRQSPEN